jgi:CRP/FNR family transcriptional regulator
MDKVAILEQFTFYRQSSPAVRSQITAAATMAALPATSYFYHQGDRCSSMALVGSGSIRVFKVSESGRELTLYHVQNGQACLVNMLGVLLDSPAVASAQADVATQAVLLPPVAVREWIAAHDGLRTFVFGTMAARLVDVLTLAEEITFRKMDSRLADYLMRRFENNGAPVAVFGATHEEIAAELGTAREVVTRLLHMFEHQGGIEITRGKIRLRNDAALRSLAPGSARDKVTD